MRPTDDAMFGVLVGGGWLIGLDAACLGEIAGVGRVDVTGLLGQIAAGAIGATVALAVLRLILDALSPSGGHRTP